MAKKIESLLENIFKKVSRQKVKWTAHSPNNTKIEVAVGDALRMFNLIFYNCHWKLST